VMGRATQGVKLIDLRGTDEIAAVTKVDHEDEPEESEVPETVPEPVEGVEGPTPEVTEVPEPVEGPTENEEENN